MIAIKDLPAGFEPCLNYPDGVNGVPVVGYAQLTLNEQAIEFCIEIVVPILPLKKHGELWHSGWDIPTRYAIDAHGNCWKNGAHGGALYPCSANALIADCENETEQNNIRRMCGMEAPMPLWAQTAKANGWTPPEGWGWDK